MAEAAGVLDHVVEMGEGVVAVLGHWVPPLRSSVDVILSGTRSACYQSGPIGLLVGTTGVATARWEEPRQTAGRKGL